MASSDRTGIKRRRDADGAVNEDDGDVIVLGQVGCVVL